MEGIWRKRLLSDKAGFEFELLEPFGKLFDKSNKI